MTIGLKAMSGRLWLAASNILTLPRTTSLAWRNFFTPSFTHPSLTPHLTRSRTRSHTRWNLWMFQTLLALLILQTLRASLGFGVFQAFQKLRAFCIPLAFGAFCLFLFPTQATAAQQYERMSDSVRSSLQQQINDSAPPRLFFDRPEDGRRWLNEMSRRLAKILPKQSVLQEEEARRKFLIAVHYEATRAGLDAQLMLAVMHVESAFRKYAISSASARGLMQVMPFWTKEIGDGDVRKLFQLRANLRYGAVILRHYLDKENGDLNRALGRYNGSLGRATYPNLVHDKLKKYWTWPS